MITATEERLLEKIVLHDISWQSYENLLREIGESHYRLTYDDGALEIMALSFEHENVGEWISRLIVFLTLELRIPLCSGGSTTLKTSLKRKGLEPDKCYWISHEKEMRGKKTWDDLNDPPPDLAVEIDITRSSLDRQGIYAALQIPELWRYDGSFKVLVLGPGGKYKEKAKSPTFPWLPLVEFAKFVGKLGSEEETNLTHSFIEWLRTDVAPRKNAMSGRKNGSK
jgi:Uma2 family endonuclease